MKKTGYVFSSIALTMLIFIAAVASAKYQTQGVSQVSFLDVRDRLKPLTQSTEDADLGQPPSRRSGGMGR